MIRQISIRNFRSIASADIECDWITTLVGANDAGKSNVLRALNLFFNRQTGFREPFDFSRDYNQFAPPRKKKTPEIEIRLRLELPGGYRRKEFPDEIVWSKVWREDGEVRDREIRTYVGGDTFPPYSKIPAFLDRIQFTYIPAIKDQLFFQDLQGQLYDVLASVAAKPLKESAGAFQDQLGDQLGALLKSIELAFGEGTEMRLPQNLREIFESLEINSGDVPLSRRGDGVKIRHIPMILGFMADKRDALLDRGGVRYTHIWGFEEPENNVEMSGAFQMADELVSRVAASDKFQLFTTTHSPIFYRLDQQPNAGPWVVTHFVEKSGHDTRIVTRHPDEVDATMGLMPLVAPFVAEAKQRYETVNSELIKIRALPNTPTVFVEGATDVGIFRRAWVLFSGHPADAVNITDGEADYGGASAVHSRALAWLLTMRHKAPADRARGIALFDADSAGTSARDALGSDLVRMNLANTQHFKVHTLRPTPNLVPLRRRGFNVPIDLEAYYTDALWAKGERLGWLEEKTDLSQVLNQRMLHDLAKGGGNPFDPLDEDNKRRLTSAFTSDGKARAVAHLVGLSDAEARVQLANLEPVVRAFVDHLIPA